MTVFEVVFFCSATVLLVLERVVMRLSPSIFDKDNGKKSQVIFATIYMLLEDGAIIGALIGLLGMILRG